MDHNDYMTSAIAHRKNEISCTVTFEYEIDASIPQLGKQHMTLRYAKAWAGWLFTLANLFRVDLGEIDWLHDTIDYGDVECADVNVSVEDGQTVVTAEYKGKEERL